MKKNKPSLAARAVATMIGDWSVFRNGDYLSTNLNLAGFESVSHGNFAAVIKGMPGQVIKVFSLNDLGYQFLVDYALVNPNAHMPIIFSYSKSGNYGIVEMEELVHKTRTAVSISNYIDQVKSKNVSKDAWGQSLRLTIIDLDHAIKDYNIDNHVKLSWDHHEGNIMFRDKIPVLCDVVYGENLNY